MPIEESYALLQIFAELEDISRWSENLVILVLLLGSVANGLLAYGVYYLTRKDIEDE